jgi:hypothetical protein
MEHLDIKRDAGPYAWEQKDDLKIIDHLLKTVGFTGSSGDPETVLKNLKSFRRKSKIKKWGDYFFPFLTFLSLLISTPTRSLVLSLNLPSVPSLSLLTRT